MKNNIPLLSDYERNGGVVTRNIINSDGNQFYLYLGIGIYAIGQKTNKGDVRYYYYNTFDKNAIDRETAFKILLNEALERFGWFYIGDEFIKYPFDDTDVRKAIDIFKKESTNGNH